MKVTFSFVFHFLSVIGLNNIHLGICCLAMHKYVCMYSCITHFHHIEPKDCHPSNLTSFYFLRHT